MKRPSTRLLVTTALLAFLAEPAISEITYTFDAELFEDYGTISTGDSLTGTLIVDETTGTVVSIAVGHATAGDFLTSTGFINVFNNAFGGGVDAITFQGLDTTGT